MQAAPVGIGLDQAAHDIGGAVVVDAELRGEAAHLHTGALEREGWVDPHRQPRALTEIAGDAEGAGCLAFAFEVHGNAVGDRALELGIGLTGTGKADPDSGGAGGFDRLQLAEGSDIEAVDMLAKPSEERRVRICLHGIMKRNTRGHAMPEGGDLLADECLVIDEQGRATRLGDQLFAIMAANHQPAVGPGIEPGRNRPHCLHA